MPDLIIRPDAQHPGYKGAMVLGDADRDTQFVTFDTIRGGISVTTLASKWRADTVPLLIDPWDGGTLASFDDIVADDVRGNSLSLPAKGIHPFVGNGAWDNRHISVVAARVNILKFYFWVESKGYPRSANKIKDLFFDYFIDDWSQLFAKR